MAPGTHCLQPVAGTGSRRGGTSWRRVCPAGAEGTAAQDCTVFPARLRPPSSPVSNRFMRGGDACQPHTPVSACHPQATHTPSTCHPHVIRMPFTHQPHAIQTSACHSHITHMPPACHPHTINTPPTHHSHTTCVAFTHHPRHPHAIHMPPTRHHTPSTSHLHVTRMPPATLHLPPTHHPSLTIHIPWFTPVHTHRDTTTEARPLKGHR